MSVDPCWIPGHLNHPQVPRIHAHCSLGAHQCRYLLVSISPGEVLCSSLGDGRILVTSWELFPVTFSVVLFSVTVCGWQLAPA